MKIAFLICCFILFLPGFLNLFKRKQKFELVETKEESFRRLFNSISFVEIDNLQREYFKRKGYNVIQFSFEAKENRIHIYLDLLKDLDIIKLEEVFLFDIDNSREAEKIFELLGNSEEDLFQDIELNYDLLELPHKCFIKKQG